MKHAVKPFLTITMMAAICALTVAVHAQPPASDGLEQEPAASYLEQEPAASYKDEEGRFIYDSAILIGSKGGPLRGPTETRRTTIQVEPPGPSEQPGQRRIERERRRRDAPPTVPEIRDLPREQRRPAPRAAEVMERARLRERELDERDKMFARREEEIAKHREELAGVERRLGDRKRGIADRERELDGWAEQLAQQERELGIMGQEIEDVVFEPPELRERSNLGVLIAVGLILVAVTLWVCALIDCLGRSQDEFPTRGANDKLVWVLVLLFTSAIGALLYVFLVRGRPRSAA